MFAIFGGSGLTNLATLAISRREVVRTPYGEPSGPLTFGTLAGVEAVFLPRHGYGHTIPPHLINYRANLWALREAGVEGVLAVTSVGGIRDAYGPGALVVPDQIIDYTCGRAHTFFEGLESSIGTAVSHIDFTWPYAESVRQRILAAAQKAGIDVFLDVDNLGQGQFDEQLWKRINAAKNVVLVWTKGCKYICACCAVTMSGLFG